MNNREFTNLFKDPKTNWKYILIVVLLAFFVGGGILTYQYLSCGEALREWWLLKQEGRKITEEVKETPPEREESEREETKVLAKKSVIINNNLSGMPSSPMDLTLEVLQFSEDRTTEITVVVGKRIRYPTEWFEAKDTSIEIQLPRGLERINCPLPQCEPAAWRGDIIGEQVKEFKIEIKAVENGEWIVEAKALSTDFPGYEYVGDTEKAYILVKDDEILISGRSFTSPGPAEKAAISFPDLIENTETFNGQNVCTGGIFLSGCEVRVLAESYYKKDDYTFPTEPQIWIEGENIRKWNCFEDPHPCQYNPRERPEFCNAELCGIFEFGGEYGHLGQYEYMIDTGYEGGTLGEPAEPE